MKGNGGELRVRTHGAKHDGLFHLSVATRLNHVGTHEQVVEIQGSRSHLVVANTAYSCSEVHDVAGLIRSEHSGGFARHGEVEFGLVRSTDRGPGGTELLHHNASEKAITSGHQNGTILPEVAHAHPW